MATVAARPKSKRIVPRSHRVPSSSALLDADGRATGLDEGGAMDPWMVLLPEISSIVKELKNETPSTDMTFRLENLLVQMKTYGKILDQAYKNDLDACFEAFREVCAKGTVEAAVRGIIFDLIQLRSSGWGSTASQPTRTTRTTARSLSYGGTALDPHQTASISPPPVGLMSTAAPPVAPSIVPSDQVLVSAPPKTTPSYAVGTLSPSAAPFVPGQIQSSPSVTKTSPIMGQLQHITTPNNRTLVRDEIVIRNADSGKVMGIRGRRVHLIEQLSETIISFQRVAPGTVDRRVQISGGSPENIQYARNLIEHTIRRNATPDLEEIADAAAGAVASESGSSESPRTPSLPSSSSLDSPSLDEKHHNGLVLSDYNYTIPIDGVKVKISCSDSKIARAAVIVLQDHLAQVVANEKRKKEPFSKYARVKSSPEQETGNGEPAPKSSANGGKRERKMYTREELLLISKSPLSKQPPFIDQYVKDTFTQVYGELTFKPFDADEYMKEVPSD
ncbi:unnamed protein product [Cyprideis torosa]|uniref:Uncharacterized protein n=1 Tax=Cyprideis torosa TaxID=163714 RepID=A0A7R8W7Z9_9CRUS|nr:unnamed protein product [Cyprideis torosa]CAG0888089.1 unnamed protein product [Cyprideis torosa]